MEDIEMAISMQGPAVHQASVPAGKQKRDSVRYDTETLPELKEFAYIYSRKGFDFGGGVDDQRISAAVKAPSLREQPQSPLFAESCLDTPKSPPQLKTEVPEISDTEQELAILHRPTPTLVQDLPSVEDRTDSSQTGKPSLSVGKEERGKATYLETDRANSTGNHITIPSRPQSTSNPIESRGTEGSHPSKKSRRFRRRKDRDMERMKSDSVSTTPSISTLSKLKALFHPRSSISLKPEPKMTQSPLSTAGSWVVKTGQRILIRSRSSGSSSSEASSGESTAGRERGDGLNAPPSPAPSTKNRRQTTPTNSDPSTNMSLRSPAPPSSTAPSSLSSSLTAIPHISAHPSPATSGPLEPWQCTLCLEQLGAKAAWLCHEESHILRVCDRQGYDGGIEDDNDNWFYSCGFCSVLLKTWFERTEHISDHYDVGITMASWNPLTSPYPMQRHDFSPVRGFPACWSWEALLRVQRGENDEAHPQEKHHWCRICDIDFPDTTTIIRHTEIWHCRPICFTCPPLAAAQIPGLFFDAYDQDNDMCFLCGDIYPPNNWPRRIRHLKRAHGFARCSHNGGFYREEQFVRHVANAHAVGIEFLATFVERCRREEKPPALAVKREKAC